VARLIRTEKEVEGRFTEQWTLHEGGKPPSWAPPKSEDDPWRD
jgi:hypothetical protein